MVEVRTRRGDLLSLPLDDDSSGFRVVDIEGLGPVKATLVSSSFAGIDGEQYQSSRREARDLKLKIELDPDPEFDSVDDLRQKLYSYFMPKSEVSFRLYKANGLEVDIIARVESCEPEIFTREPTVTVSTRCFKPDFIDLTPKIVQGTTTSGEVGMDIDYKGSVETGIQLVINVNRSLPSFSVYHLPPSDEIRTMDFDNAPLIAGDVLTISTVPGAKGAILVRNGAPSSVLYGISPQSNWFEMMPGLNNFRVYAEGADIPLTIEYINRYGGL